MNVGMGSEAALFPEKEYIMDISFAVQGENRTRTGQGHDKETTRKGRDMERTSTTGDKDWDRTGQERT